MKYTDDNLEWHDENELIRKLDAVEAVLNMADSLEDVIDILMTVPSVGQIVRCKECIGLRKHELIINDKPYITSYWCERVYPNIQIPDDQVEKHFCSFGERREP